MLFRVFICGKNYACFQFLRGHPYVEQELSEIQSSVDASLSIVPPSIKELFTQPHLRRPLFISLALMFGQQMSGVNAVLFFCVSIFEDAGTELNSFVEAIIVAGVQVVGTVAAAAVVDKAGRRLLLVLSDIVMVVALIGLGK